MNIAASMPRIITGVSVVVLLSLMLYLGGIYIYSLAFIVSSLALWEFYSLFWEKSEKLLYKSCGIGLSAILFLSAYLNSSFVLASLAFCLLFMACVFLFQYGLKLEENKTEDFKLFINPLIVFFGVCYISLALCLALGLSLAEQILLFGVVTITDSAAYFVGIAYGKHKVWVKVSPKKSIEGCIGGLIGNILFCAVYGVIFGSQNFMVYALVGLFLAFAAMIGDFFESALKRMQDVKDSGAILPGHGGILDRIDSFLFVVPVYILVTACWVGL